MRKLQECIDAMPLIAVLRGLPAQDALSVGQTLIDSGFTVLEVTLRMKTDGLYPIHPEALRSLELLITHFGEQAHITAGTVKDVADIEPLKRLRVETVLAPNFNPEVVAAARSQGIDFIPGIETLDDAKAAFEAGAIGLKVFPCFVKAVEGGQAECRHSPDFIRTLADAVPLPAYPSGGIDWLKAPSYMASGAKGINVGGDLYTPERSLADIEERARQFVRAVTPFSQPFRNEPASDRPTIQGPLS